jgi:hypothetical protein
MALHTGRSDSVKFVKLRDLELRHERGAIGHAVWIMISTNCQFKSVRLGDGSQGDSCRCIELITSRLAPGFPAGVARLG